MYFRRNSSFLSIDDVLSSTLAFYFVNASAPVCLPLQEPLASRHLRMLLFFSSFRLVFSAPIGPAIDVLVGGRF